MILTNFVALLLNNLFFFRSVWLVEVAVCILGMFSAFSFVPVISEMQKSGM